MATASSPNVKSLVELETQPRKILNQIRRRGHPVLITKRGKPHLVIMDASAYEQIRIHHLQLLLEEGLEDIRAGRAEPFEDFMKEFERANKIPSDNRRKRKARR